ncbi:ATP-binding cassette domain-containing protein [Ruminococcus gauvreauii]|uniref:ATP-binding cassette domain-containing protein n=1 Tax=Ruminococcus gauvreauii TaxID=438033 RepID=A0ABY5VKN6_9FIRM|nr:ATP-binding cassette domain-containing protein [Ruminococcus gauvreauii]UWP61134.1 ATP-binding cassette domain-containing protein [Ruminococcus gauvreauii]
MQGEILRIEHLSKSNHSQNVLRSVSFQVLPGRKAALLSNPLEKQCMIDILFGGDNPDTGKIFVNEVLCGKNIPENLANGGIYYLASRMDLIPNMTVARNLFLSIPGLIHDVWIRDRVLIREVSRLLKEYGMKDISPKARVKSLSYCQILCLEIIIAVQKGAKLIVFDDVFNQIGENGFKDIEKMIEFLHEKNISVLLFSNRYHTLFASFDSLIILQNGVTTGILKRNKITVHNFTRYYSPAAAQKPAGKGLKKSVLTIKTKELEFSMDRGDILGVWSLDGDYLMRVGKQRWELLSGKSEDGTDIAVSMNGYRPDKIYKDMSLIDNITYLANDKVSNALGIINKRLQRHMAHYSLALIHSEYLMEQYKNRKNLRGITLIDQLKVITAKWLCVTPQVFIYINPFIILDESTIMEFREILEDLTRLKISVIIMSVNHAWLELTCDAVVSIGEKQ